nr:uncharacterized protein LOC110566523 [Meriones unguiculatus]
MLRGYSGAGVGCSGAQEPGGAAASPLPAADPARKVGQGAGGGGPRARVAEQGREERREEGTGACHSRAAPSVHRGCAEWCTSRRRPSRIRRLQARTARLCSSAAPEALQSPRVPPGAWQAAAPSRVPLPERRGPEVRRPRGRETGRQRSPEPVNREPSPPAPGAPRPVPAALARATGSPDEPRWLGLSPECTPCNSSPCACPTASRRAPNSSSGMMTPLLLLQLF